MNPVLRFIMDLFYPPKCMICRRVMDNSLSALCGRCDPELPEYEGAPRRVLHFDRCAAPFFYKEPIRGAVLRFKFRGMQEYSDQFAAWMAVSVRDKLDGEFDFISWVPCSARRKWKRGFDQAELLAKSLSVELDLPAVSTLVKRRDNRAQSRTTSAAQRKANVSGVYRVRRPELVAGKRILLVDDVLTTGSTMSECGMVLRLAGAQTLSCAVVAITAADHSK